MSAVETAKPVDVPDVAPVDAAPAPVPASDNVIAPVEAPKADELPKTEEAVAPVEEKKDVKAEEKVVEPIHSGALGYKAPGLKNAFRYSKKYFWFGEEPVPAANLSEYLRGEKPDIAHSVAAWSSQTGKGLLFFVKHADKKEHPAGVLNLAYATELAKDGTLAFNFKLSGHKHAFEAQNAPERDGWFVAVEKAIADAKEAKEGIESSEGYKEQKEKIGKPVILASASAAAPKKSTDATPKLADSEAPVVAEASAPAARTGSSSSSSADEQKKAKKSKSKSRSVSRGKRASIFGGLLGKHKDNKEGEAAKAEAEVKKEESTATAPQIGETSTTAPVITTDIPKPSEELKTDVTPAPVVAEPATTASAAAPAEEVKAEETPKAAEEKPKPTKRGSIFGSFVEKLKSPKDEKKEHDFKSPKEDKKEADLEAPAVPTKEPEVVAEAPKPLEEAQVAAPVAPEAAAEPVAPKAEETKPTATGEKTPSKERDHFSFGKFFGSKERAKSPAAQEKAAEPKVDAAAPKIEDTTATSPVVAEPAQPIEPVPATESKAEASEVKAETPKKEKRGSIFGQLTRSLSKATGKGAKKDSEKLEKEKKDAPATVPETTEEAKTDAPVVADKPTEAAATTAPVEKTIGDVPAEAVTVGEPKSAPAVATT